MRSSLISFKVFKRIQNLVLLKKTGEGARGKSSTKYSIFLSEESMEKVRKWVRFLHSWIGLFTHSWHLFQPFPDEVFDQAATARLILGGFSFSQILNNSQSKLPFLA